MQSSVSGTSFEKYPNRRAYAKPKLRKALNELGVYKQFAANCTCRWNETLGGAFIWERTPEGQAFWSNILKKLDGKMGW